jgi:DNA repair exonuclease SbcCD nuclease subunit
MKKTKHLRIAAYSDIHHHEYSNGITGDDVRAVENEFTNLLNMNNVDVWIFGGDRFLSRNPLDRSRMFADFALRHRNDNTKCSQAIMLVGNHDRWYKNQYSGHNMYIVDLLGDLRNVIVVDKAIKACTPIFKSDLSIVNLSYACLPSGHKPPPNFNIIEYPEADFNICLFHDIVRGSRFSNGTTAPDGLDKNILDYKAFDLVLGGDNHEPQDLDLQNTYGIYIGAPMQHNWGDSGSKRGFWIIDLYKNDDGSTGREVKFIKSSAPEFIKEEISITSDDDLIKFMSTIGDRWRNNIVKLTLTGLQAALTGIRPPQLQDKLKSLTGARQVKVIINFIEQKVEISTSLATICDDSQEWADFVNFKKPELAGLDVDRIKKLGLDFINVNDIGL